MAGKSIDERKTTREGALAQDAVPRLLAMLSGKERIELENFSMNVGDLELWIPTGGLPQHHKGACSQHDRNLLRFFRRRFSRTKNYQPIHEVHLGATKSGGAAGAHPCHRGIHYPPFVSAEHPAAHPPIFALDVFDMEFRFRKCSWRTLRM